MRWGKSHVRWTGRGLWEQLTEFNLIWACFFWGLVCLSLRVHLVHEPNINIPVINFQKFFNNDTRCLRYCENGAFQHTYSQLSSSSTVVWAKLYIQLATMLSIDYLAESKFNLKKFKFMKCKYTIQLFYLRIIFLVIFTQYVCTRTVDWPKQLKCLL